MLYTGKNPTLMSEGVVVLTGETIRIAATIVDVATSLRTRCALTSTASARSAVNVSGKGDMDRLWTCMNAYVSHDLLSLDEGLKKAGQVEDTLYDPAPSPNAKAQLSAK